MRATRWVAEICQAFENLVELEKEGVRGEAVHLGTAPAPLFDIFPAVEDPCLHLVVDHARDVGVLLLEDVPQGLDEGLGDMICCWSLLLGSLSRLSSDANVDGLKSLLLTGCRYPIFAPPLSCCCF